MIPFVKAHACGNDFLIVEEVDVPGDHAALTRRLCERHTGVGADGVEYLSRGADGGLHLRLFNADGSEAELSGNGTRCVAASLAFRTGLQEVTLTTLGGAKLCRVLSRDGDRFTITTGMGVPAVTAHTVHLHGVGEVEGLRVDLGNPHFVLFPEQDDFAMHGLTWQQLGDALCNHRDFPDGTNVEFVRVRSADEIEFRIFERGVGPTQSSGTGTSASAAAAILTRGAARSLTVIAQGGAQRVTWPDDAAEMLLTGPAQIICTGQVSIGQRHGETGG